MLCFMSALNVINKMLCFFFLFSFHYFLKGFVYTFQFTDVPQNVGFIGLGNMGCRMANNLIKAGYKVAVHDM